MSFFIPTFFKSPNFFWCSKSTKKYILCIGSMHRDLSHKEMCKQGAKGSTQNHEYPKDAQCQNFKEKKNSPGHSPNQLAGPEEGVIHDVTISQLTWTFKSPRLIPFFINLAPPSQSDQQPSSDIFDHPKIQRTAKYHQDECDDG